MRLGYEFMFFVIEEVIHQNFFGRLFSQPLNGGKNLLCVHANIKILKIVVVHQCVEVLHSTFLPAMVDFVKIAYRPKRLLDPATF
jgi:hypothetical protein